MFWAMRRRRGRGKREASTCSLFRGAWNWALVHIQSRTGHVPQPFWAGDGPRESRLWGVHHKDGRGEEGYPALQNVGMARAPRGDHVPMGAEASLGNNDLHS